MDVVRLKDAAHVRLVRRTRTQALDSGFLVSEGLQEGERKFVAVERLLGKCRYGFFDFYCIHGQLACVIIPACC